MYAEPGLMFPLLKSFPHQLSHTDEDLLCHYDTELLYDTINMDNLMQASTILGYNLGGGGDLFKAPEPIIEESVIALDPVSAAMTIISNGRDVITETIQNEHLNDVLYDCNRERLAQYAIWDPFPQLQDVKIPMIGTEQVSSLEKIESTAEGEMQKSVSSECLNSMEWVGPNFLDFQSLDFETAFRLRRAYSEGDIQCIGNSNLANSSNVRASFERQLTISEMKAEERQQKLSRYRTKKTKRNFERKIKYACRKALADSQPRVRGRFAKTEECEVPKLLE